MRADARADRAPSTPRSTRSSRCASPRRCSPRRPSATPSWPAASGAGGCTGSRTRSRTSRRRPGSSRRSGSPLYADLVPEADSEVVAADQGRRRDRDRQDQRARVRLRLADLQRRLRADAQPVRPDEDRRRIERRRGGGAGGAAWCRWPTAATTWARCATRPRSATSTASGPRSAGSARRRPRRRSRPRSAPPARWPAARATSPRCWPRSPGRTRSCRSRSTRTPRALAAPLEPPDPARLRIGWLGDLGGHLPFEPGILELCEAALGALGAEVVPVEPRLRPRGGVGRGGHAAPLRRHVGAGAAARAPEARDPLGGRGRARGHRPALHAAQTDADRASPRRCARCCATYDALALPSAQVFPFDVEHPLAARDRRAADADLPPLDGGRHPTPRSPGCPPPACPPGFGPARAADGHAADRAPARRPRAARAGRGLRPRDRLGRARAARRAPLESPPCPSSSCTPCRPRTPA